MKSLKHTIKADKNKRDYFAKILSYLMYNQINDGKYAGFVIAFSIKTYIKNTYKSYARLLCSFLIVNWK